MTMRKFILAAALLAATATGSYATSLSDKVQMDNPGVTGGGATANPLAKPDTGGLSDHVMRLNPGVTGVGGPANQAARPDDAGSLSAKATRDLLRRAG
jgi:hypothetical protein